MSSYLHSSDIAALVKLRETMPDLFAKAWADKKVIYFDISLTVLETIDGLMSYNDSDRVLESHPWYGSLNQQGVVIIIDDWQQEFARKYGIVWGSKEMVATIDFCCGRYLWPNPLESIVLDEWLLVNDHELIACQDESEEDFPLLNTRTKTGEIIAALYDKVNEG